ncbi:hypothetical protein MVEN_00617200 [Mycena venus]|uniref:Uncharacterized protein n=1 Tax=Mycena venus TaxID=2733690 RepID=A0A8H7D560_9AGAR|nr:hypothetical protein MVEN_00617200 [Mycena venus]
MLRNAISALSASVEDMTWTPRGLWQLPRGFSLHRRRTDSVTNKRPLTHNSPSVNLHPATEERDIENPESTRTGRNALRFALETLSTVSSNIPFGSVLSGVIDPLLNIADRIELTSDNTQGFVELAARIQLLSPLVSQMARNKPEQGGPFVEALKGELQSITDTLKDADSRGKLDQFFNSQDNASSIAQHNNRLTQMIADATLSKVDEVLQWLQDVKSRIGANSEKVEDTCPELFGGTGGKGWAWWLHRR